MSPRSLASSSLALSLLSLHAVACDGGGAPGGGLWPPPDTSSPPADTSSPPADTSIPSAEDPCGDVPLLGRCAGDTVEYCFVPTGSGEPTIRSYPCAPDERCEASDLGARCVLDAECRTGDSRCVSGGFIEVCDGGQWDMRWCDAGCAEGAFGAACKPPLTTVPYQGTVSYEARRPNADFDDWSATPSTYLARGLLVVSLGDGEVIDAARVDDDGVFSVEAVPADLADGDDYLVAVAARFDEDPKLLYAVADPELEPGEYSVSTFAPSADGSPDIWLWTWTVADIPSGDVLIPEAAGSGAMRLFDYLRYAYDGTTRFYGQRSDSALVVWLGFGVTWDCGACFAPVPAALSDTLFVHNQIWIPGGPDASYWGDAVTAHELGHWVMSTFGYSPGEGGRPHPGDARPPRAGLVRGLGELLQRRHPRRALLLRQAGRPLLLDRL